MSGAQGARPVGQTTPTTYESVGGEENRTRTDLRSREDQGAIQIEKVQDKVDDAAGRGVDRSTFGAKKERPDDSADAGATGTGGTAALLWAIRRWFLVPLCGTVRVRVYDDSFVCAA